MKTYFFYLWHQATKCGVEQYQISFYLLTGNSLLYFTVSVGHRKKVLTNYVFIIKKWYKNMLNYAKKNLVKYKTVYKILQKSFLKMT